MGRQNASGWPSTRAKAIRHCKIQGEEKIPRRKTEVWGTRPAPHIFTRHARQQDTTLDCGGHMAGGMKGIPEGASVVIPRLFCRDVAAAIDFCKNTFGAGRARTGP